MEPSYKARKIIGKCLLIVVLVALGTATWCQWKSPLVRKLATHGQTPIEITLLTNPAMFISYTPSTRKVSVRVLNETRRFNNPQQRIQKLLSNENIPVNFPPKYVEPVRTNQSVFWKNFKHTLSHWRYNPLLAANAAWAYLSAWHNRRTNLSPAEAVLLAMELTQLEENDFTVRFPPPVNKKNKKKSATVALPPVPVVEEPDTQQDRPLIIEVLNASGRKGLASELTQYLREQNQKGHIRIDVWQYDNYPTLQDKSWIEDYSGRQIQVKQLGNALGITGEIRMGNTPNGLCNTRLILGKDFKMPL